VWSFTNHKYIVFPEANTGMMNKKPTIWLSFSVQIITIAGERKLIAFKHVVSVHTDFIHSNVAFSIYTM